jgi:hypothetical protein
MDFLFLATGVPNIFVFQKRKFQQKWEHISHAGVAEGVAEKNVGAFF